MHNFLVWMPEESHISFTPIFLKTRYIQISWYHFQPSFQGPSGMNPFLMLSFLGWTFESGTNSTPDQVDHAHLIESVQNALSVCKTSAKLRVMMHGQETIIAKTKSLKELSVNICSKSSSFFCLCLRNVIFP